MAETSFSYARLDFLLTPQGLVFLEFNKNGQYAWLDLYNKDGMLSTIAQEIIDLHDFNLKKSSKLL